MRVIFSEPVPYTDRDMNVELFIHHNNGLANDEDIARYINSFDQWNDFTERDVRKVVERLNYNKFEGIDNKHQYRKINGKYHVIDLNSPHRQRVIKKIKLDAMADLKRMHITLNKLSDVNLMNYTMNDVLKYLEEEEDE